MKVLSIPKITSTSLVVLSTLAFSVGVKGQDKDLCAGGGVAEYGADVSYTIHHASIKPSEVFGTSRKSSYEALLQSCRDHGGGNICDINEENRLSQNLLQPQSMKVRYRTCCTNSLSFPPPLQNDQFHLFQFPCPIATLSQLEFHRVGICEIKMPGEGLYSTEGILG